MNKKNTALRNNIAAHIGALFNGGTLEIRTGTQPSSANDAATGTLLATVTIPNPAFTSPSNGSVSKSGTWSAVASASGTAGWARMKSSDGTLVRDFSVGMSGADLIIDNDSIVTGEVIVVNTLTITADGA